MLALATWRDGACPCGCGGRAAQTLDPATQERWRVGEPVRCQRKTAIMQRAELYKDSPQPDALLFPAELMT